MRLVVQRRFYSRSLVSIASGHRCNLSDLPSQQYILGCFRIATELEDVAPKEAASSRRPKHRTSKTKMGADTESDGTGPGPVIARAANAHHAIVVETNRPRDASARIRCILVNAIHSVNEVRRIANGMDNRPTANKAAIIAIHTIRLRNDTCLNTTLDSQSDAATTADIDNRSVYRLAS